MNIFDQGKKMLELRAQQKKLAKMNIEVEENDMKVTMGGDFKIKDLSLGYFINFESSLIYILFAIFILFFFNKILSSKEDDIEIINTRVENKIQKRNFDKIILDFEKKYLNENHSIFYSKLIEILRDILETKWIKNISKMTFSQINNLQLDEQIKLLLKNIYYKEYSKNIIDNEQIRLEYISKTKELIK